MPTSENESRYTIPDKYKSIISKEFLQILKRELKLFFAEFPFENEEDWINLSSTGGWFKSFEKATQETGLHELKTYYNSLEWEDSDLFESDIIDIALEYKIISPLSENF
ncbi:hypothetical protein EOL94_04085 [bacterium]|nr:hypothetical protein [bacterium]